MPPTRLAKVETSPFISQPPLSSPARSPAAKIAAQKHPRYEKCGLDVEAKPHHIAVLNDVIGAFETHAAGVLRPLLAAIGGEVGKGDRLGANEALLEIAVDLAGRLRRLGAVLDGPGMRLLWARGEERDQAQQPITGADDAGEAGLLEPERGQEFTPVIGIG